MSVRIVPARSKRGGFEYDIWVTWPEGGRIRERGKCPPAGKDAARKWAEARERVIIAAGKAAYRPLCASGHVTEREHSEMSTLADFWPRVVRDHYEAERKKASTLDAVQRIYRLHLEPALGTKRLDAITTADVAALKGRLAASSKKTANNILSVLSRALRCAVAWEVIPALPCRFGLFKLADEEMEFYEVPIYRALVEASRFSARVHLLVLLAGSAGLRRGELRALRWDDIDFARRQITIRSAFWQTVESTTKGNRSRIVPMTTELHDALKAARGIGERVLYGLNGKELSNRSIRNWLSRAQRRTGLEANGGAHILRHTFCSHLAMAGVPAIVIQKLAGHRDLKTTMRYMHLSPSNRGDAMETLERSYKTAVRAAKKVG